MKKLVFSLMALFAVANIYAEDLTANLKMRNGTVRQIVLDASSEIELQRALLKVHAPVSTEYDILFLLEDVATLDFGQSTTEIDDASASVLSYRLDHEMLYIEGLQNQGSVRVYDASGVLLLQQPVRNGSCSLSLSAMPKGMLLVKVNHETLKILKK